MTQRLVLFGATGATGTHLLRHALADGLAVRVLVRSPDKLPADLRSHPQLEVVQGDLTDLAAIDRAIAGAHLVISVAGNAQTSKDRFMTAFVTQAVASMRLHGVKRLVYQAGAFSTLPGETLPLFLRLMRPTVGRLVGLTEMLADNDAVMAYLVANAADIDWTVTRPGMIAEGPSKGTLRASETAPMGGVQFVDLAAFNLQVAKGSEYVRKAPYVNY